MQNGSQQRNRTVLVTGGAGFIGSHLVDQLVSDGVTVRVVDNFATGHRENLQDAERAGRVEFTEGSVDDRELMKRLIDGCDTVFNLACLGVRHSLVYPFENHRANAEGTLVLLEAALACGVKRFVHCSTSEVYGTARYVPMPEDHPTVPHTVYGSSKLAGECYARSFHLVHGLPTVIIRPFNTFGPRSHHEGMSGEIIPKNIVRALAHKELVLFGDGGITRDFTYVTDTAAALVEASENESCVGQTLNVGTGFEISMREVLERLLQLLPESKSKIVQLEERPGDVKRLFADPSAFKKLSSWNTTVSFEDGLQKTVDYFRHHPRGIAALSAEESARNWEVS